MDITVTCGGITQPLEFPAGAQIGELRAPRGFLDDMGAPETFKFAVNGIQVEDDHVPAEGDVVTLRPISGEKGA